MIKALLTILNENDYRNGVRKLAKKEKTISEQEHSDLMKTLGFVTVGSMRSYIENFTKKGEKYLCQKDTVKSFDAKLFFTDPLRLGILAATVVALGTGPLGLALICGAMPSLSSSGIAIGGGLACLAILGIILATAFTRCLSSRTYPKDVITIGPNHKKEAYTKRCSSLNTVTRFFNTAATNVNSESDSEKVVTSLFAVSNTA